MSGSALQLLDEARYQAATLGNLVRGLELAAGAWGVADAEGRYHTMHLARWLLPRLAAAGHDVARLCDKPAWTGLAAGVEAGAARPEVGACWALLWDADVSREAFLARFVLEPAPSRRREALPAGCGAAFAEAIARAEHVVLRLLCHSGRFEPSSALLGGKRFALRGGPAAESYAADGGSIGAAAAAVIFSAWTETPLPPGVAITGALGPEGEILPVGALEAKVRTALRELPDSRLRAVYLPAGAELPVDDRRLRPVGSVRELLEDLLGPDALSAAPAGAVDIEGTIRLGAELYGRLGAAAATVEVMQLARRAIEEARRREGAPARHRTEEFTCLWQAGAAQIHLGDPAAASQLLERARALGEALWAEHKLDPSEYFAFRGNLAVLLRATYRYDAAKELLLETLAQQRALRQQLGRIAHTLGNLGELCTFRGEHEQAEAYLLEALHHLREVAPEEVPRELCYLGNLHLRRGDPARALEHYVEGQLANRGVRRWHDTNEAFLRYGLARARLALDQPPAAIAVAERAVEVIPARVPYPRQLILKVLGLAHLRAGDEAAGRAALRAAADLTFARGALLRFGLGTALGELAIHLLGCDQGEIEEAGRAARTFAELAGEVPGLPGAARDEVEALVGRLPGCRGELAEALRRLVGLFVY